MALPAPSAAIAAYSPSGDFKTDYLAYCKIWGLTVHPQIVRSWNAIQYEAGTRSNPPRPHSRTRVASAVLVPRGVVHAVVVVHQMSGRV